MSAKRGAPCGYRHGKSNLTDEQVRQLRADHIPHVFGYIKLAAKYGCSVSTARDICTYRTRYSVYYD